MTTLTHPDTESTPAPQPGGRMVRAVLWLPGLAVALGAAVATAHGLYEVAAAAQVPAGIAWLYPLITDGLALVAYTATARLVGSAARYAWSVVVLAAGLSGLAQAVYLAGGAALDAPPVLRFGVGAWPAVAAEIVAHLLYLLAVDHPPVYEPARTPTTVQQAVDQLPDIPKAVRPPAVHTPPRPSVPPAPTVPRTPAVEPTPTRPALAPAPAERRGAGRAESPERARARAAAARHAATHHRLPTATELQALAEVSRGTAGSVLKALREHPAPLHLIHTEDDDTIETRTQP